MAMSIFLESAKLGRRISFRNPHAHDMEHSPRSTGFLTYRLFCEAIQTFFKRLLQYAILEESVGQIFLESTVFNIHLLNALGVGNLHSSILDPQSAKGLFPYIYLQTDIVSGLLPVRFP